MSKVPISVAQTSMGQYSNIFMGWPNGRGSHRGLSLLPRMNGTNTGACGTETTGPASLPLGQPPLPRYLVPHRYLSRVSATGNDPEPVQRVGVLNDRVGSKCVHDDLVLSSVVSRPVWCSGTGSGASARPPGSLISRRELGQFPLALEADAVGPGKKLGAGGHRDSPSSRSRARSQPAGGGGQGTPHAASCAR